MGCIPPPIPSPKQFKERWDRGMRTLEELDPALYEWRRQNRIMARAYIVAISIGVCCLVIMGLMVCKM